MMWMSLLMGLLLGALWHGFNTAVVLGFIGWLVGMIAGSMRRKDMPSNDRLLMLEKRIAALERRLAKSEPASAPAPEPIQAEPVMEPLVEPIVDSVVAPTVEPVQPTPVPPPAPPKPAAPNPVMAWLTGGNMIARVGLIILFLGLAFLLKWAADHASLPRELRVGAVALIGVALLAFGWCMRQRRRGYSLGLQGGGVAVLYLTTFAALRLYGLVSPTLAFVFLAAIAVLSGVLAVMQDALVLAAFGAGGGFLAPILASTGEGSHVALFGYYLLLNLGIAGVALFRSWRSLNIMGFLFTFVIGTAWGMRFYSPEYFDSTEPFLVAFFLLYVAVAMIQALRMAPAGKPYLDGILVFGTPIAAFSLQAALLRDTQYGPAISCIAAAGIYLALAAMLRRRDNVRMLFDSFVALGVVFVTLSIPLALDARWTSALWALEGAAVVWIGLRQRRRIATSFGLVMQVVAGGAFWMAYPAMERGMPWIDAAFLGAMLVAIAGLWSSRLVVKSAWPAFTQRTSGTMFVWGFAWLLVALHHDIRTELIHEYWAATWVGAYSLIAVAFLALSRRLAWREAAWPSLALVPVLALLMLATIADVPHPFASFGALAWGIAAFVHFHMLRRHESLDTGRWIALEHLGGLLVFVAILTLELHWQAVAHASARSAWPIAALVVPASAALIAISPRAFDARWPIARHAAAYRLHFTSIAAVLFGLWVPFANFAHDAGGGLLPYMPFLNAIDLAHILAIVAMVAAMLSARRSGLAPTKDIARIGPYIAAALVFLWLNAVLLRTLHHWAFIPYRFDPLMRSMLVQAALSIFWSVLALACMLYATRSGRRSIWVMGAVLMAVVVVKLFVVELAQVGAVERIVSFIAVGLLMLAIGYVAPVPPRAMSETKA